MAVHVDEGHDVFLEELWLVLQQARPVVVVLPCVRCLAWSAEDKICNEVFHGTNLRVKSRIRIQISSVKIVAGHGRSIITRDHTINIQHRNDLEHDAFTQLLGRMRVADDGLDEALHHVACVGFAGVHAPSYDHVLLSFVHGNADFAVVLIVELGELHQVVLERIRLDTRCDRQKWHVDTAQTFAQHGLSQMVHYDRLGWRLLARAVGGARRSTSVSLRHRQRTQESLQLREGVRIAVREVDLVGRVCAELILERQLIEVAMLVRFLLIFATNQFGLLVDNIIAATNLLVTIGAPTDYHSHASRLVDPERKIRDGARIQ